MITIFLGQHPNTSITNIAPTGTGRLASSLFRLRSRLLLSATRSFQLLSSLGWGHSSHTQSIRQETSSVVFQKEDSRLVKNSTHGKHLNHFGFLKEARKPNIPTIQKFFSLPKNH